MVNQEWKVFLETIQDPEATPQIFRLGWCLDYPDANNFDPRGASSRAARRTRRAAAASTGQRSDYDDWAQLVLDAAKERDPKKRTDLYAQAEEILVNTTPSSRPIYWYTSSGVTKPYVTRSYAVTGHNEFVTWDVSK